MAAVIVNGLSYIFRCLCASIFLTKFVGSAFRATAECLSSILEQRRSPSVSVDLHGHKDKVDDVRRLLMKTAGEEEEDPIQSLIFLDAIQRLGLGHHYEEEIHTILTRHYVKTRGGTIYGCYSLHDVALSFRLLRQRGFHVSAKVFNNFKSKDGSFKPILSQDIRGLLELYEATQLSFQGEYILDEAQAFTTQNLLVDHKFVSHDHDHVNIRLKLPYHKTITRLTQKNLVFRTDFGWEKPLRELAQVELQLGKSIYQEELIQVTKWWDGLGLSQELKLARNQPLKWYTSSMAILINDISLSEQRVQLTKSIAFVYLIDDIFDLYGTLDELAIFTEAVDKWDYDAIHMLPDYMRMSYKALIDTTNEIAHTIREKHGFDPINSLKQTWTSLCRAFLVEAEWLVSRDLPSAEEYLANGKVSSGVHVVLVHLFFMLGLGGPNEGAVHLKDASTSLISYVAAILRLWDDLGSAKDEHQNGRDGSYIECYMKDHGVPFNEARGHVLKMIATEWKRLNKECFEPWFYREACLNVARMVPLMYTYDEEDQSLPLLEEYVNFMLLDPSNKIV